MLARRQGGKHNQTEGFLGEPMRKKEPFGQVAIRLGFVKPAQVDAALEVQQSLRKAGKPRLIGMIMLEMGMISSEQLIEMLKTFDSQATPPSGSTTN